jgi:23S rRNA (uracil1939-C5)-methyltransferase
VTEPKTQLVKIEKPVYGGASLARIEGKAVFVPLTLPGEQVRIRIVQEKRRYATAEAEEILSPAAERITPACKHFGACGGCSYQHANYDAQLKFKLTILRETLERAGVPLPVEIDVLSSEPWHYRNRIRLAFDAAGNPGYRGRRSHAVVAIEECPIAAPILIKAALAFREALHATAMPAMRPTELSLFCNADESAVLASLFIARPAKVRFDDLAHAWHVRVPELIGAELQVEDRDRKPARTLARWGANSLAYRAAGLDYRVDQGSFFQVNRWLVDALVERVSADRRGKLAWDLFAGVGLFARKLAESFGRVVAVESAPASIAALRENLKGRPGEVIQAETLSFLRRQKSERPDLIVLDPPRTGLGAETTAELTRIGAPAIVDVSCDPATLARDLRVLTGASYVIESLALVDLFPQTFHLETVVKLRPA